jgi:hypothetical protein
MPHSSIFLIVFKIAERTTNYSMVQGQWLRFRRLIRRAFLVAHKINEGMNRTAPFYQSEIIFTERVRVHTHTSRSANDCNLAVPP